MIDTAKVLYEHLTASGTSLYTLNGTRVWTAQSEPVDWNNGTTGIMMSVSDDGDYVSPSWVQSSVTFYCYGGNDNASKCQQIYAALYDRLSGVQSQIKTSGTIEWARMFSGDPDDIEPDSGYKRARASYLIQFKEN